MGDEMKKISIVLLTFGLFFITGCGCSKKELKTIVCERMQQFEKYNVDSTITIEYDANSDNISSFKELSTLTSSDEKIRNYFKEVNDKYYASYGNYYNSFVETDKATMSIEIDFEKITVDEFLNLYEANSTYLTDNQVDYKKIVLYYTEFEGYECH